MTDWATRTQTFLNDDKSWLASEFGVDMGIPIELDLTLFDFTTDFPNGFLPSGIVLAKLDASDVYGLYDTTAAGGAGLDTARGHLLMPVDTSNALTGVPLTSGPVTAALFTRGRVREARLPTGHALDAAAKADLPLIEYL